MLFRTHYVVDRLSDDFFFNLYKNTTNNIKCVYGFESQHLEIKVWIEDSYYLWFLMTDLMQQ